MDPNKCLHWKCADLVEIQQNFEMRKLDTGFQSLFHN